MAVEKFVGIGTSRKEDVLDRVYAILEAKKPSVLALDENPVAYSSLIQMRTCEDLCNPNFIVDQREILLRRELDIGHLGALLYAMRHPDIPVYFVDGSFREPLSDSGEEIGVYPYFTSMDFAASVDMMTTPIILRKQRIPTYPGWDFEYELIHAYQVNTRFDDMDRAIWQRNAFSGQVLSRICEHFDRGMLAFVGDRKRFSLELYRQTAGLSEQALAQYRPLTQLIPTQDKVIYDAVLDKVMQV